MAKGKGVRAGKKSERPGKKAKENQHERLDRKEKTTSVSADEIVSNDAKNVFADGLDTPTDQDKRKRFGRRGKNQNDFMQHGAPDEKEKPGVADAEDIYALDGDAGQAEKTEANRMDRRAAKRKKQEAADIAAPVKVDSTQTKGDAAMSERRARSLASAKKKRRPLLSRFNLIGTVNRMAFWRKPKPRKSAEKAMSFADSGKRVGKQGRRKRRLAVWIGAGALAVAVVLTAVLVPLSQRDAEAQETAQADAPQADVVQAEMAMAVPLDEETLHALEAQEAQNAEEAVPTTAPEEFEAFATPTAPPDVAGATTPEPEEAAGPIETTRPDPTQDPIEIDDLVEDFIVEADLYYNDAGYYSNYYEYTDEELYMLAQVIHGEAKGESTTGRIAVGNVVMNRVFARGKFGSSIKSVITAPSQFTGWSAGIRPSSSCKYAARKVLDDEVWVVPQNIQYFNSNKPAGVNWGSHKFWKRIGGHNFYTHNYSGRSRSNNIPPALFERTFKWPQHGCKPEKRVYRIQYMLERLGYDVTPDAYFGKGTVKALKKFQQDQGLDADGIAGPSTIKTLIDEFGMEKFYIRFYT